jgi:hypothetical protein
LVVNLVNDRAPPAVVASASHRHEVVSFTVPMLMTLFLSLILPAPPVAGEQDYRRVTIYDGHAALDVPAAWNEIPREVLDFYALRAAESSGGRMTESYQFGFRPADPEIDFSLPQFLIQIRESGRLNYRQFLRLPTAEDLQAAGERSLAEHVGPLVRGLALGETDFDRDSFALHLSNTLDLSIEGETSVESVAFLTERGLFTIHFYAHASEISSMAPIFQHIAHSVQFDEELAYQPKLTDRWPPRPTTLFLLAALIAVAVLSVHLLRRGRGQS